MILLNILTSALTMTAPVPNTWACELAPAYGQGHADEGRIDDISSVGLNCAYRALTLDQFSLWPVLGANTQNWTIYRDRNAVKEVNSYSTQDLAFGGRLTYAMFSYWDLSYEALVGQGKGNLKKLLSTDQSAESQTFDHLRRRSLTQSVGVEHRLSERLALGLAVQYTMADQAWNASNGDYSVETVDSQNHLSLTGGLGSVGSVRDSSHQETTQLKVGLRMFFD